MPTVKPIKRWIHNVVLKNAALSGTHSIAWNNHLFCSTLWGTVCFLYLIPDTSDNKMITLNQTRNICPYYIYEHVIILLWIPIGHRTKDQSLQSWPLVFQYPPCLERDQKYPVSFLSLIIWYILFNTVILPLHVNISAGFRGQVTRKKKSRYGHSILYLHKLF